MTRYPLLQSGFISSTENGLSRPEAKNDSMYNFVLNKEYLSSNNIFFYNENITKLYNNWCADNKLIQNFNFREEIIKAALVAFGEKSIYNWILLQSNSKNIGAMHAQFILETVKFVFGDPRSMQISQWIRLLDSSVSNNVTEINVDTYFDKEKGNQNNISYHLPNSTIDFIKLWLAKPNGFEDLLISLFVIFGYRPYITDTNKRP